MCNCKPKEERLGKVCEKYVKIQWPRFFFSMKKTINLQAKKINKGKDKQMQRKPHQDNSYSNCKNRNKDKVLKTASKKYFKKIRLSEDFSLETVLARR